MLQSDGVGTGLFCCVEGVIEEVSSGDSGELQPKPHFADELFAARPEKVFTSCGPSKNEQVSYGQGFGSFLHFK